MSEQIDSSAMGACLDVPHGARTRSRSSLCAELIVRALASQQTPSVGSLPSLMRGAQGKPYFECSPSFHFSISHSKNMIVVGIAEAELGVDIELMRPVSEKLINRCLSKNEIAHLSEEPAVRTRDFLRLWTQKEAYLKYCGCGITRNLAGVDLTRPEFAAHVHSFDMGAAHVSIYCEAVAPENFTLIELCDADISAMANSVSKKPC